MLASLANPDEVKFLLAKGAKVNAIDGDGQTALFWASKSGSLNCINELLLAGADSTIKDKAGQTAVDVAHDPSTADELRGNAN
jgi:ankyrin repeat protein